MELCGGGYGTGRTAYIYDMFVGSETVGESINC